MINNIPAELKALPQWVCADINKRPIDPKTNKSASVTNPATWGTYEEAVGRYMICTGDVVRNVPIEDRQDLLDMLYAQMKPPTPSPDVPYQQPVIPDNEVLAKAKDSFGARFDDLWAGDWLRLKIGDETQSPADAQLGTMLAHFTSDEEQWCRLFSNSGLSRSTKPKDYLRRTFRHCCAVAADQGHPGSISHGEAVAGAILASWQAEQATLAAEGFHLATPTIRPEAFYGIHGEIAMAGSAHTEAVPATLAVNVLARFCATLGREPIVQIGDDRRSLRPYVLIIGPTSRGRKGTSAQLPNQIFGHVDTMLGHPLRCETTVSSGEGLVWMTRDPIVGGMGEIVDHGIADKRVLLEISEFSGVLAQAKRESSVMTANLRDAWDGRRLSTPNKNSPCSATGAHFVAIGHITREEFTKLLTSTDIANGFANRFMMVWSARQKVVDDPQPTPEHLIFNFAQRLAAAVQAAWQRHDKPVLLSDAAKSRWKVIRRDLEARSRATNVASLMARCDTYVRILAAAIALINMEQVVESRHLDAALAWVDYWEDTANFCFTAAAEYDSMIQAKTVSDEIVAAILKHGGKSVARSIVFNEVTNRGKRKDRPNAVLERAVTALQNEAPPRVVIDTVLGKGRPKNQFSLAQN